MRLLPLLLLAGCEVTGVMYGGGDGLTLGSYTWAGATRSELREAETGETFDPVAYGYDADRQPWVVGVTGDTFSVDDVLASLGVTCDAAVTDYQVQVTNGRIGVAFDTIGDGYYILRVTAPTGEGGPLEGSYEGTVDEEYQEAVTCTGTPETLSVTWSFDEDTSLKTRCLGCSLLDDIDLNLPQ